MYVRKSENVQSNARTRQRQGKVKQSKKIWEYQREKPSIERHKRHNGIVSVDTKNRGVQFSDYLDVNAVESSSQDGDFISGNQMETFIFNKILNIFHVHKETFRNYKKL